MKLMRHLELLDQTFACYERAGIKIGADKTKLLRTEVQFLGHLISNQGISMIPSYVERILKWEAPKCPKELNTMLGFFGYYADHIVNYSTMTAQMNTYTVPPLGHGFRSIAHKTFLVPGHKKIIHAKFQVNILKFQMSPAI